MKRSPHFLTVAVLLLLLGALVWRVRRMEPPRQPGSGAVSAKGGSSDAPDPIDLPPVRTPTSEFTNPWECGLDVDVVTGERKPVAGITVLVNLVAGKMSRFEGLAPPTGSGKMEMLALPRGAGFSGRNVTDDKGSTHFKVLLPRQTKYLEAYLRVSLTGESLVRRRTVYELPIPAEGETHTITFVVEVGTRLVGTLRNMDPEDAGQMWLIVEEKDKKPAPKKDSTPEERRQALIDEWFTLPKPVATGRFESAPVPPVPLRLRIENLEEKYVPVQMDLFPPHNRPIEVALTRNPKFKESGKVVFRVEHRPSDAPFSCRLVLFSEDRRKARDIGSEPSDVPRTEKVPAGRYQVFALPSDGAPVWAQAAFATTGQGTQDVSLRLQAAGSVRLKILEQNTGKVPNLTQPSIEICYRIGSDYIPLFSAPVRKAADQLAVGGNLLLSGLPSGQLRLIVGDFDDKKYKRAALDLSLAGSEELSATVLLENSEDE